uniref:Uncharacterized protein n=1 Tax=Anopheles atroparvus TaxID=41427 RepID=A0AAG5CVQ3_ANOAO
DGIVSYRDRQLTQLPAGVRPERVPVRNRASKRHQAHLQSAAYDWLPAVHVQPAEQLVLLRTALFVIFCCIRCSRTTGRAACTATTTSTVFLRSCKVTGATRSSTRADT